MRHLKQSAVKCFSGNASDVCVWFFTWGERAVLRAGFDQLLPQEAVLSRARDVALLESVCWLVNPPNWWWIPRNLLISWFFPVAHEQAKVYLIYPVKYLNICEMVWHKVLQAWFPYNKSCWWSPILPAWGLHLWLWVKATIGWITMAWRVHGPHVVVPLTAFSFQHASSIM